VVSALTFALGAAAPLVITALSPLSSLIWWVGLATVLALAVLGTLGAQAGGAPKLKASLRVVIWGILAMAATWAIGSLVGTTL